MSAPTSEQAPEPLPSAAELTALPHPQEAEQVAAPPPKRRLVALDAWRGLTILLMLLVNNVTLGQYTPPQLVHASWDGGLTLTDLVFPWFLFCAGASIPFSLGNTSLKNTALGRPTESRWWPDRDSVTKLFQRAVPLYLVGALLTSVENKSLIWGLGVLQLIALASLCAGLFARFPALWRLGIALALLLGYRFFCSLLRSTKRKTPCSSSTTYC